MKYTKALIVFYAILYCIIAFTLYEFNPNKWGAFTRFALAVLPIAFLAMYVKELQQQEKDENNN